MKEIKLSGKRGRGKLTLVDNDIYNTYNHLTWHLSDTGYAIRRNKSEGGTIRLHRLVVNAPEGKVVDHLNGNKLDNRKSNLRICTQKENTNNRKNIKGYSYDRTKGKWIVRYKGKFYGRYKTKIEAEQAYKLACSGVKYKKARRKYYMLPKGITKTKSGYYTANKQVNNTRKVVYAKTLAEAKEKLKELEMRIKS